MSTVFVTAGRALASVIVQSWVTGSKPESEEGIWNPMLLATGLAFESRIAWRNEPAPLSLVLDTVYVVNSQRDSSGSIASAARRDLARRGLRRKGVGSE